MLATVRTPAIIIPQKSRLVQFRGIVDATGPTVTDFSIDIGPAFPDRLIVVAGGLQGVGGLTSIVIDPSGQNLSMTQDAFGAAGSTGFVYSLPLSSGQGPTDFRITVGAVSVIRGFAVWTLRGLASNLKKNSAVSSTSSITMSVTAGDNVFGGYLTATGPGEFMGATKPEKPQIERATPRGVRTAEWTPAKVTATYTFSTSSSSTNAYASYA